MTDSNPSESVRPEDSVSRTQNNSETSSKDLHKLTAELEQPEHAFPVIGIGASAGGLESLEKLFEELPANSNAAFVVVQHLSPDFKSMMDEILRRKTKLEVCRVENGVRLRSKTVYLIQPNFDLELEGDVFQLRAREISHGISHPIDRFFSSLAISRGPSCAAMVCSGSGSDGSRGIRDICERGGMVLVEDPQSANFDGMPRSAVETGIVDFVGSIPQLAVWLSRFIESYRASTDVGQEPKPTSLSDDPTSLEAVTLLLRNEYGIDFLRYKPNMIVRRIERRLQLMHFSSIDQYVRQLKDDPNELNQLYQDLMIGVTRFFRDTEAFEILSLDALPDLVEQSRGRTLRVWTPGCATGEEAYSLAISISEAFEKAEQPVDAKIFATDAHRTSLEKATTGIFTAQQLEGVSDPLKIKYFDQSGADFKAKQKLRKLIVFAPHNLLQDASFTKMDLVVCRNTLIYFKSDGQRRALALMHFGLRKGGILFLGPSETPGQVKADYQTVDRRWRIYRKIADSSGGLSDLRLPTLGGNGDGPNSIRSRVSQRTDRLIQLAFERMAETYVPPSFVTDADFRLIYSTEGASEYVRRQQGKFDATLPDLLRPELKTTVLIGLQRVARQQSTDSELIGTVKLPDTKKSDDPQANVATGQSTNGSARSDAKSKTSDPGKRGDSVRIIIRKIEEEKCSGFLVTLQRTHVYLSEQDSLASNLNLDARNSLETELRLTKESLQASIEEMESSNEELQATNEEMVASNEELQSTNEELHSVNEELYTVNSEHQNKIEELTEMTEDMENLFRASDMATIFLDEDLRIRRLTPKAISIFKLTNSDIGRQLDNFRNPLDHLELYDDIKQTLQSQSITEIEVLSLDGQRFLLRLLPYTSAHYSKGVVLTLIDLFRLEATRKTMETREARFRGTFENAAVGIAHVEFDGTWLRVNERLCEIVGYTREELLQSNFQSITHPEDLSRDLRPFEQLKIGKLDSYSLRKRYVHKSGHEVPIDLTVSVQNEPHRDEPYCIAVVQDATEQVNIERQLENGLKYRDQFLAVLSHELRNPLASLRNAVQLLKSTPDSQEDVEQYIDVLDRQTNHMTRLVEDLLDTSRIAQNKIKLQRELIDMKSIVVEAVDSMRSGFLLKQQTIELVVEDATFSVIGDRTRLLQVIENLLSNARRYTQLGGSIKVRLFVKTGQVTLRVADNGPGIPKPKLETIFTMFTRAHETGETQGGLGIGLALAKMLMEQHGGTINADSAGEGQGAQFTISLPLVPVPDTGVEDVIEKQPTNSHSTYRIVLVDDDDDARITMEALLELDGHSVVTAADGLEGLAVIADNNPEFALVDLSMPGLNGIELANELIKQDRSCILIALTGHGQQHDRDRTAQAGFQGHLVKPIDLTALNELMHELSESTESS